jgi:hypothetical protein
MSDSPGSSQRQRRKERWKLTILKRNRSELDAHAAVELQIKQIREEDRYHPDFARTYYPGRIRIDYGALPPALARKVSARAALPKRQDVIYFTPGPWGIYGRMDPTRLTPPWVIWALGGLCCASPIMSLFLLAPLGTPDHQLLLLMVTPWVTTAATSVGIRHWKNQAPLTYTRTEAALVRKHTMTVSLDLPLPAERRDHHAIQAVAVDILTEIESSPAWQSPHCDLDRIQLDLAEEMFQIQQSCLNLAKLHNMVIEAKPRVGATSAAREALEDKVSEYEALYREARAAVIHRVAALHAYRQRLTTIETLLDDLTKATELAARSDDFTETFAAIVRDTAAAERTEALSADLDLLRAQLEGELAFISGRVINDPDLAMPLTVRPALHRD